ncbi:tetratricopeptide repeat protein [Tychonema sp. BBK16]|uniref:tetratricopeptide repeat protein n=1 Tax=Tychonema sp. BBK16 TaxID=2699888 RepID=UPI001F26D1CB|nr:tetratricopeptide repeat protein [Tychonema sp. BBK16]MCF6374474.1 tetratricopeptide repeat protein [Tychonema sp. BBK16]
MSEIAIALFFLLGLLLATVGYIWGLVQAFQEEVVWGLLYWFIPFAALVFYIKKWSNKRIRKTFLIQLAAWPMFLLSGIITMVSYGTELAKLAQSGTVTVNQGSSEQSSSSFPSDLSISSSPSQEQSPPSQEQSPSAESSTELSPSPIPEPTSGTVGVQQGDFKQLMKLGYAYYGQGDYQTALINFNKALQVRPGNAYAVKAIENTKIAIAQKRVK